MIDRRTQVMSWLEGLAQDDWPTYHSDSEVQEIAKAALALMEEQSEIVRCKCGWRYCPSCGARMNGVKWE